MRTHMETLLDFKPPLGLELIFSYQLSIIDCISCSSQEDVVLPISGFLSEAVWDSALPDHSSILMPSVECANKNMKHHGLVICTTPSLTFRLISCVPDYNPKSSTFWGRVWKCRKWKSDIGLCLLPCDSTPWQWVRVTSPTSHWKCVKSKKIPSRSRSEVVAFCSGHVCVLVLGWNSTSICCYSFVIVWQVAGWNIALCAWLFCCLFSRQGTRFGGKDGGWFCFIFASFWAVNLWSFLIIWIPCSSFIKFFLHWRRKCFFILLFLVALPLCKEEPLHCLMSSSSYLQFSSWFIIWKQISSAEYTA